jgi:hypothetical protein
MSLWNRVLPLGLLRLMACHPTMSLTRLLPLPHADTDKRKAEPRHPSPRAGLLGSRKLTRAIEHRDRI